MCKPIPRKLHYRRTDKREFIRPFRRWKWATRLLYFLIYNGVCPICNWVHNKFANIFHYITLHIANLVVEEKKYLHTECHNTKYFSTENVMKNSKTFAKKTENPRRFQDRKINPVQLSPCRTLSAKQGSNNNDKNEAKQDVVPREPNDRSEQYFFFLVSAPAGWWVWLKKVSFVILP